MATLNDEHKVSLERICRLCSTKLPNYSKTSKSNKKPPKCEKLVSEINILYDIDLSNESIETHASFLCKKCYNKITNTRKVKDNKKRYELFEKERNQFNSITYLWVKHTDNATCNVCELVNAKSPNFGRIEHKIGMSIATSPPRLSQEKI